MVRFFTKKNGDKNQAIPVNENKPKSVVSGTQTHGIFDIPEDAPQPYQDLATSIANMYNNMDTLVDDEVDIKTMLSDVQGTFAGHYEAYEDLLGEVEHEISKLNQISNHLKNLNKLSTTRGVNLKFLQGLLEPAVKQNTEIYSTFLKLPQVVSGMDPEWNRIVEKQKKVLDTLTDMLDSVVSLRTLQYDFKKPERFRADWVKLRKGALNRFIKSAGPINNPKPPSESINPSSPISSANAPIQENPVEVGNDQPTN